jgi:hypothetical protein
MANQQNERIKSGETQKIKKITNIGRYYYSGESKVTSNLQGRNTTSGSPNNPRIAIECIIVTLHHGPEMLLCDEFKLRKPAPQIFF